MQHSLRLTATLLSLLLPVVLAAQPTTPEPVTLGAAPYYFRQYNGINSELLELKADGQYQMLKRRDDGTTQTDYGTWKTTDSNRLYLQSGRYKENLVSPPFTLSVILTENQDHLSTITVALSEFLSGNTGTTVSVRVFTPYINRYTGRDGAPYLKIDSDRLYGQDASKELTRQEIKSLHSMVQSAQTSTTPVTVTLTPKRWDAVTYLEVPEVPHSPWVNRHVASSEDVARTAIADAYAGRTALYLFVQISEAEFRRESTTPHEYLFVPGFSNGASSSTLTNDAKSTDPAVNPIGALKAITSGVQCHLTSTTSQVAGYYSQPGPTKGRALSGKQMYLFPDQTYFYLTWADISPRTIRSRGTWEVNDGLICLSDDGTLKVQYGELRDNVLLPISFPVKSWRTKSTVTVTGILGFPWSYEWLFSDKRAEVDARKLLFYTLEWNHAISPMESDTVKAELIEKHWRPDYAEGKPGAKPPEWN